jgi:hypothetical protein
MTRLADEQPGSALALPRSRFLANFRIADDPSGIRT